MFLSLFLPGDDEIRLPGHRAPFGATRADSDFRILEDEPAFGVVRLRVAEREDEFIAVQVFARNHLAMMIYKLVFKKSAKIGEAGDPIF